MKIFGHRLRWYAEKYVAFEYMCAEGNGLTNFLWSKIKNIFIYFGLLGGTEIAGTKIFGISLLSYIPGWLVLCIPVIELVKDFLFGILSRRKLKIMQIKVEWRQRKGLDTWEKEKMDMIRELHAKECPNSTIKHEGYVEEDN